MLYHGKVKAVMKPAGGDSNQRVQEHAFYNMAEADLITVEEELANLRKPRYDF